MCHPRPLSKLPRKALLLLLLQIVFSLFSPQDNPLHLVKRWVAVSLAQLVSDVYMHLVEADWAVVSRCPRKKKWEGSLEPSLGTWLTGLASQVEMRAVLLT
jgi:hypothetical protein